MVVFGLALEDLVEVCFGLNVAMLVDVCEPVPGHRNVALRNGKWQRRCSQEHNFLVRTGWRGGKSPGCILLTV